MELVPYILSTAAIGFFCWCLGVYQGSQATVKQFIEEMDK